MEKKPNKLPGFLNGLPSRSYMLMMAAGLYLAYTGYQLCHGIMTGESSGVGFLIGGIAFILIGAAMVLIGIYGVTVNGKQEAGETSEEDSEADSQEDSKADPEADSEDHVEAEAQEDSGTGSEAGPEE